MIKMIEDIPSKITGFTSIFIQFDFNQDIVDTIKSECEVFNYSKKTHIWEVPVKNISHLIDLLSVFDNISIISRPDDKKAIETLVDPLKFKTKPFQYQLDGINYGVNHKKWLLLDDMGLGKTLQAIYIAQELKERHGLKHCMIICGVDSLRSNWKREIEKHSNLDAMILGDRVTKRGTIKYESVSKRAEQLLNDINEFFIITTLTTIRNDDIVSAFNQKHNQIDMIILDEAQKCKDINSLQGKNLLKLDAEYKLGMSGTLLVNDPLDVYASLKWIGMEHSTIENLKKFYCVYNPNIDQYDGYKNIDFLKEILSSCSLRRTKDDELDLPVKNIIDEYVSMSDEHTKIYDGVVNNIKEEVDLVRISSKNLLGKIVRLRQATSCPQVLSSKNIISTKVLRCVELAEDIINQNEKVVIFSSFKETCYQLGELLKEYNPYVITGDTNDNDTNKFIVDFQNNKNSSKIIIATQQKLGTGVTLNSARYMIFVDCPWTNSDYSQATDRIYRIGTTKPVFIYNLICSGTIDVKVSQLINDKKALAEYIIDDKIENENALASLQKYIQEL